jgi:hypothetical protein
MFFILLSELAALGLNGTVGNSLGFAVSLSDGMVEVVVAVVVVGCGVGVVVPCTTAYFVRKQCWPLYSIHSLHSTPWSGRCPHYAIAYCILFYSIFVYRVDWFIYISLYYIHIIKHTRMRNRMKGFFMLPIIMLGCIVWKREHGESTYVSLIITGCSR